MSRLTLFLLGPPRIELDGEPIEVRRRKAIALIVYLAVTGQSHSRDALATLFWPEHDQSRARAGLRRALAALKKALRQAQDAALGEGWLDVDRETVGLSRDAEVWLDVVEFQDRLAECRTHGHPEEEVCPACLLLLAEAVALYRDDFLAGFTLPDSPGFDEWQFFQTEGLRGELAGALERLAHAHSGRGEFEPTIAYARRWLALDPLHEPVHRCLMQLYAQSGQRAAALRQYAECERILQEELGVEPSEQIQEMVGLLLRGEPLPDVPTLVAKPERKPRLVGACPYRGLSAFREKDAPFFFGREDFTARLIEAVREQPMVAVIVGSSGSGKSSAVFAGLLPRLREEGDWLFVVFRPGGQPFHSEAAALLPLLEPDLDETDQLGKTGKLAKALSEDDVSLHDVVLRVLQKSSWVNCLLLVVDQFEELYALCPEPEARRRFLDGLLAAVEAQATSRAPSFVLLLTIRADFLGQALTYRPFADALQESALIIGPMTREELRSAIEKPAEKQGAAFEAGLVARLLDDVGEEPGNLPLLEFALMLLWEWQEDGWMTHAGYESIGRVEGALARYADQVYECLAEDEREGARQVFLQLVHPGEGTADTRRVTTRAEVGEANWALIQHLADQRLVVAGRDTATGSEAVEVVHEALIQGWGRLRAWIEADRAFRTWQERLRSALRGWEISGQDEGAMLRGVPLAEAEGWLEERGGALSPAEKTFIRASVALRERRQAERERRRQRIVVGLAVGLVVALVLAGLALMQRREALESYSHSLAANAQSALSDNDTATGLVLALTANSIENPPQAAQKTLLDAAFAPGPRRRFEMAEIAPGVSGLPSSVAISPDVRTVLTGLTGGTIVLWDLETGAEVRRLVGHTDAVWNLETETELHRIKAFSGGVNDVTFSPDGETALSGADDGTLILWDVATGREIHRLSGHSGPVLAVDISPDGRTAVSGGTSALGGELILWDLETGAEIRRFAGYTEGEPAVFGVAFGPDGRTVLAVTSCTGGTLCTLRVWDVETWEEMRGFGVSTMDVLDVATSPDGATALTASADYLVELWDLDTGERLQTFEGHGFIVLKAVFTPDGRRALSGAKTNGSLILWNLESGEPAALFQVHTDSVTGIAISPDGRAALSSSVDGTLVLWDLVGAGEIRRFEGHTSSVSDVAFTPDGKHILSSGGLSIRPFIAEEYTLRLWDMETGEQVGVFEGHTDSIFSIAISPDGRTVLSASADGSVRLWDLETGEQIRIFEGHTSWVIDVDFSPDGRMGISSDWSGNLILWDMETSDQIRTIEAHTPDRALGLDISPDGRVVLSSGDGGVFLWDVETGEQIRQMEGSSTGSLSVAFSPDGAKAISTSWQDGASLWDVETGREIRHFGAEGTIWRPAFSPDGRTALFGAGDDTVVLWDLETGAVVRRFTGHATLGIWGADISPDGRTGVTSGEDFRIIQWQLAVPSLDELREWIAANRYVRELTCEERETCSVEPLCEE